MVMTKQTPKTTVLDFLILMTPFIFATQRNILSEKWVSWFKAVVTLCKQSGYGDDATSSKQEELQGCVEFQDCNRA